MGKAKITCAPNRAGSRTQVLAFARIPKQKGHKNIASADGVSEKRQHFRPETKKYTKIPST